MQDFGTKADNSPPPGGQLSAAEFNNLATENENAVLRSGQSLSGAAADQLAKSLFLHAVKSETFQDSGVANAYVATPVSGTSGVLLPADYSLMNGAIILLKASAANTAASTINIGQTTGTLLGTKAIVDQAGNSIIAGTILAGAYIQLRYDSGIGAGSWVILPWAAGSGKLLSVQVITASGTYTPPAAATRFHVRGVGGGGGSGGSASPAAGQYTATGGGASGGYSEGWFTAAQIGTSIAVTIGAAGTAGASGPNGGGNGGTSSLGALMVVPGGGGAVAVASTANANPSLSIGGTPGALPTGGSVVNMAGSPGTYGIGTTTNGLATAGTGGSCPLGSGGFSTTLSVPVSGTGYGAGASGAVTPSSFAARAGAAGTAGVFIIEEYA